MHFKETERFRRAIAAFDRLNGQDPRTVEADGQPMPKELHDALAMTRWIENVYPDAGESVHLAARCQHLCRWEVPRDSYPEGRAGYHRWRTDLKKRHAEKSAAILRENGYDEAMVDRVRQINLKEGIKSNAEVQAIEDALCLVFLETQFEGYLEEWDDEKIIRILRKTWVKMSDRGHQAALGLEMSPEAGALIERALDPA